MSKFENLGKDWNMEIRSLSDNRLVKIDPSQEGFFDKVLGYSSGNEDINEFIDLVKKTQEANLSPFWIPIMDPSEDDGKIVFKEGLKPAVGYSIEWWESKIKELPAVEGRCWEQRTDHQEYVFLVWLINHLVQAGWDIRKAIEACVLNSRELGHFYDSDHTIHELEPTGSCEIVGVFDLGNTEKYLRATNGICIFGGNYLYGGDDFPLARPSYFDSWNEDLIDGVFGLVLV